MVMPRKKVWNKSCMFDLECRRGEIDFMSEEIIIILPYHLKFEAAEDSNAKVTLMWETILYQIRLSCQRGQDSWSIPISHLCLCITNANRKKTINS